MIGHHAFEGLDAPANAINFAYAVQAMATTVRLALSNEGTRITAMEKSAAVAITVEVMEAMMAVVVDGTEAMQRSLGLNSAVEGAA